MELAHAKPYKEVLDYFGTDPERGLSESQVKKLQDKYGPNGETLSLSPTFCVRVCLRVIHLACTLNE